MAFVAAKCTECGASIEVDNTKEAGICRFCNTAFITEKVINNYNIQNTTHIHNPTINIAGKNIKQVLALADELFSKEDYNEAREYYRQIVETDLMDYKIKFRYYLCRSYCITIDEIENVSRTVAEVPVFISAVIDDSQLSKAEKSVQIVDALDRVTGQIIAAYMLSKQIYATGFITMEHYLEFKRISFQSIKQLISFMEESLKYINEYSDIKGIFIRQSRNALTMIHNLLLPVKGLKLKKLPKDEQYALAAKIETLYRKLNPSYSNPPMDNPKKFNKFLVSQN